MASRIWDRLMIPAQARLAPGHLEEFQTALPGDLSEWDFVGDFTLTPVDGGPLSMSERAQIQEWARAVAAECTHSYNPLDCVQAQRYANEALAPEPNKRRLPRPVRIEVKLTVPPRIAEIAWETHETRLARTMERTHYQSMAESVFADPRIAHVWWLEKKPERLPSLDALTAFLKTMRQGEQTSGGPRYDWLPLADRFVAGLDEADLAYLVRRLAEIFRHFHRPDLADELDERYSGDDEDPG